MEARVLTDWIPIPRGKPQGASERASVMLILPIRIRGQETIASVAQPESGWREIGDERDREMPFDLEEGEPDAGEAPH